MEIIRTSLSEAPKYKVSVDGVMVPANAWVKAYYDDANASGYVDVAQIDVEGNPVITNDGYLTERKTGKIQIISLS